MGNAELIELTSVDDLDELVERSENSPQLLFKHSTTCPISRSVFDIVSEIEGRVFFIVVQTARDVSNAVAEKTGVRHESPQALIMKGGECVYTASHYAITVADLRSHL